ncbi:hypothetical protein [Naasia aerilata]|uniref:Uncharacterized protein n=1 Tax=Naasia aerilata TaxID=1162966 RepID=A0ABM8GGG6_9MICO|nr:hypothetical protein [Naasia aerilata]BDZ47449.1 hypothetical protein GCM10025866_33580 [Naasia aerilata]
MSARDITLGWVLAFSISMAAFVYTGISEAVALATPGSELALQLPPLLVGVYTGLVGTGLLIGSRVLRARQPLEG